MKFRTLFAVVLVAMFACQAEAGWRFRRTRCDNSSVQAPVQKDSPTQKAEPVQKDTPTQKLTDQQQCQQKANELARRRILSHGVLPIIGSFEGIGYGGSRDCGTCTPRGGMTLTGDAAAKSGDGFWYRVRSWR